MHGKVPYSVKVKSSQFGIAMPIALSTKCGLPAGNFVSRQGFLEIAHNHATCAALFDLAPATQLTACAETLRNGF